MEIPIRSLQDKYRIAGYHSFSLQDDQEKLEGLRKDVASYIQNNPSWNRLEIPKNYFRVKEELESLFTQTEKGLEKEHITKKEFREIAEKHQAGDAAKLLKKPACPGVSLWYKEKNKTSISVK